MLMLLNTESTVSVTGADEYKQLIPSSVKIVCRKIQTRQINMQQMPQTIKYEMMIRELNKKMLNKWFCVL